MMSNDFRERYQRQLLLPEVGEKGQFLLAQKRVVVVGAGGLGCTLLPLLVGSGVGHLVICDNDVVSLSNLLDKRSTPCRKSVKAKLYLLQNICALAIPIATFGSAPNDWWSRMLRKY